MARQAAIVSAVRTAIGRYAGGLSAVRPDDLAALAIRAAVARAGVEPGLIEDVYFGAANQAGEDNRNVARMAALLAGLPVGVAGCTVNRLCASGLEAINIAARMIEAGCGNVFVAGGVESMSRAPLVMAKAERAFPRGSPQVFDSTIGWRFTNPSLAELHQPYSMGETAENVAKAHNVSRRDQDAFAYQSQQRWAAAHATGLFANEIVPVEVPQRKGDPLVVDTDEHPRPDTSLEKLAALRPAFDKSGAGTVTAGNSSGINDGAAALVIADVDFARAQGWSVMALVGPSATAGVDPACMGLGPIAATRKLLERTGGTIADFDLIELNEAFAAQALPCIRELALDPEKVNVNGGAIAMGHPLGCTGARLAVTLIHEMRRRQAARGLVTLCVGVGQGAATAFDLPA
ncbi:MAG: acetyl-CoA C-acyltransferase [Planctomycetes bacterium]|nr:acetyl-CoA C-acyltransferase [Planctomycetota bacterium]